MQLKQFTNAAPDWDAAVPKNTPMTKVIPFPDVSLDNTNIEQDVRVFQANLKALQIAVAGLIQSAGEMLARADKQT